MFDMFTTEVISHFVLGLAGTYALQFALMLGAPSVQAVLGKDVMPLPTFIIATVLLSTGFCFNTLVYTMIGSTSMWVWGPFVVVDAIVTVMVIPMLIGFGFLLAREEFRDQMNKTLGFDRG